MAVAVVFVLSAGEIDLSIGSVVALSALVTAEVMQDSSAVLAVAAGLGVGLAVGAVNGLFVTLLRLPSFLVTLASLGDRRRPRAHDHRPASRSRSRTRASSTSSAPATSARSPASRFWALGAVALGHFVFRHRRFGAHVLATGDNAAAARASGIRVDRVRFAVLVLSGGRGRARRASSTPAGSRARATRSASRIC